MHGMHVKSMIIIILWASVVSTTHNNYYACLCADYRKVTIANYAYHNSKVNISEYPASQCVRYDNHDPLLQLYSVCTGSPLRLTDSQLGPDHYSSTHSNDYYIFKGNTNAINVYQNFLFTLSEPTRLAKIRLHYYSDIHQGKILPMIYFYATRHNQQVYDTLDAYYERLGVVGSPFSETINGHSNVTISVSSSSLAYSKVLMHISFIPNEKFFYLSEVEFFSLSSRSDATTNSFLVQGISYEFYTADYGITLILIFLPYNRYINKFYFSR